MSKRLSCVEVDPQGTPEWVVIWLHGLGADGHDFEPIVPALGIKGHAVRYVFPNAQNIPVTINGGMSMPAWYDIRDGDLSKRHDEAGIRTSAKQIEAILDHEKKTVAANRIVLAGFSQGGAMAFHVGLRHSERLAGIMALSTYVVCDDVLREELSPANRDVPIFQAHGTVDPVVVLPRGEAARDQLTELGYKIEWHSYPMPHAVCPEEVAAIGSWLQKTFDQG